MIALHWRRIDPPWNTLCAFFDLQHDSGLITKGWAFHQKGVSEWVAPPASPQLDRNGKALITPKTGKIAYAVVIDFVDEATQARFKKQALEAVHALIDGAGHSEPIDRAVRGFGAHEPAARTYAAARPSGAFGGAPRRPRDAPPSLPDDNVVDLWRDGDDGAP